MYELKITVYSELVIAAVYNFVNGLYGGEMTGDFKEMTVKSKDVTKFNRLVEVQKEIEQSYTNPTNFEVELLKW